MKCCGAKHCFPAEAESFLLFWYLCSGCLISPFFFLRDSWNHPSWGFKQVKATVGYKDSSLLIELQNTRLCSLLLNVTHTGEILHGSKYVGCTFINRINLPKGWRELFRKICGVYQVSVSIWEVICMAYGLSWTELKPSCPQHPHLTGMPAFLRPVIGLVICLKESLCCFAFSHLFRFPLLLPVTH